MAMQECPTESKPAQLPSRLGSNIAPEGPESAAELIVSQLWIECEADYFDARRVSRQIECNYAIFMLNVRNGIHQAKLQLVGHAQILPDGIRGNSALQAITEN